MQIQQRLVVNLRNTNKFLITFFCFISLSAQAGKLESSCLLAENEKVAKGTNVDKKLPQASVSKLVTSLWATMVRGSNSRFSTLFYVNQAGSDTYDVHLKGSLDPYFSEQSLHYLISRLNQLKVFKIRRLSFDENFKFYYNPNGKQRIPGQKQFFNPVDSQRHLTDPSPELVKLILSNTKQWLVNYNKTYAAYKNDMVEKPQISVQSIEYISSAQMNLGKQKATGYIRSTDLASQLKMMNWNSNNHAANTLFQSMGGKEKFDQFASLVLKLSPKEIEFYNGSGNNENFDEGPALYNQASCSVVVRTVKALKKSLEAQNHKLEDAMAVVGADQGATVQRYEKNVGINDGVLAKSGTIIPNVALAGMISSKTGNYFFSINFSTGGMPKFKRYSRKNVESAIRAEWARTRNQIGVELNRLVKQVGGATSIQYKVRNFQLESFEESNDATVF